jgi:hypothetical protein
VVEVVTTGAEVDLVGAELDVDALTVVDVDFAKRPSVDAFDEPDPLPAASTTASETPAMSAPPEHAAAMRRWRRRRNTRRARRVPTRRRSDVTAPC